jgi:hypothetical protein
VEKLIVSHCLAFIKLDKRLKMLFCHENAWKAFLVAAIKSTILISLFCNDHISYIINSQ